MPCGFTVGQEKDREDGLPNNTLYSYFVKEGTYSKNAKGLHGDGRPVKRDFSDVRPRGHGSDDDTDVEADSDKAKRKALRKAEKKAAAKAAKLEAKRQAKLEEKRKRKKLAKMQ